jgi:hypothetical protein
LAKIWLFFDNDWVYFIQGGSGRKKEAFWGIWSELLLRKGTLAKKYGT